MWDAVYAWLSPEALQGHTLIDVAFLPTDEFHGMPAIAIFTFQAPDGTMYEDFQVLT